MITPMGSGFDRRSFQSFLLCALQKRKKKRIKKIKQINYEWHKRFAINSFTNLTTIRINDWFRQVFLQVGLRTHLRSPLPSIPVGRRINSNDRSPSNDPSVVIKVRKNPQLSTGACSLCSRPLCRCKQSSDPHGPFGAKRFRVRQVIPSFEAYRIPKFTILVPFRSST